MEFIDLKAQQVRIRKAVEARIQNVLDHGRYIMGPEVKELEGRLAGYVGVPHAVSVSSGTDALLIALMALEVGLGDEVITTAFTFVATAEAIALLGATPVFVDIDRETYHLDPSLLEERITPRTRAIIVVDIFGQCADYRAIHFLAAKHGLAVIEDAAQSFGAELEGQRACSFGRIACTSFFPAKPLGCYGDGGSCFTADDQLARVMQELRNHGQSSQYHYERVGLNGRLDTVQAAILLAKLDVFDDELRMRQEVADRYSELLPGSLRRPIIRAGRTSAWAQYTIEVENRDSVRETLAREGIPSAVYYPRPLHQHPPYRNGASLPVSVTVSNRVLSLPMHPYLKAADQERVARILEKFC
jgi:UDP-2-acetamido-2-deoxy-ribo-hexuluronate aminotransferase